MMQTRDKRYGAAIYDQVKSVLEGQSKLYRKKYGSMAHKLPVLIRSAGLAQALAFVQARGESPHQHLLNNLAQVVLGTTHNGNDLAVQSRTTTGLHEYMYLTYEVLAALFWYKRFAQSVLKIDPSDASNEDQVSDKTTDEEAAEGDET